MSLLELSYSEFENEERSWTVNGATFGKINLIVGKNSTGKSRLLAVVNSFARVVSGKMPGLFLSGTFEAKIKINKAIFDYRITFAGRKIAHESLRINEVEKFTRDENGDGLIYFERERQSVHFKVPADLIVAFTRRDAIQHPYLIELNEWAASVVLYPFGSDFGRNRVMPIADVIDMHQQALSSPGAESRVDDPSDLVRVYYYGFNRYGADFDQAIISDMGDLGYEITDVGAKELTNVPGIPVPAFGLFTVEKDLGFSNPQITMSQGMFRALALCIHMNVCVFGKEDRLILIDDIGEGLDFERAKAIIDLLIRKAKNSSIQLLMTSNDRFVMNEVPLEHWSILKRKGRVVQVYNERNSKAQFENFKFIGLNNFDFFASDHLESGDVQ